MKGKKIVWADDDTDDLLMMRQVLTDIGEDYHILEVHNGREALDLLENQKLRNTLPCLVILDMNMPVLNGKETLSIMKGDDELKKIPVVFFTTSNSELDKLYCKKIGVEMITKPPRYANLKEAIKKLLAYCEANS